MAIIAPRARKKVRTRRQIAAIQSASFHKEIDLKFMTPPWEFFDYPNDRSP
jgi:hypothetical protein